MLNDLEVYIFCYFLHYLSRSVRYFRLLLLLVGYSIFYKGGEGGAVGNQDDSFGGRVSSGRALPPKLIRTPKL